MYLTCPNCETVYTVRAAMLKEGQGEVRCGACRTLFNALDHLSDELPEDMPLEEPMATAEPARQAPPEQSSDASQRTLPEHAPAPDIARDVLVPSALSADWHAMQHDAGAPRRNLGMLLLAVLLLSALGGQYVWFEPRDLVSRFPQTESAVNRFCRFAGCIVPARRDPARIQMLSRDVRAHPRFEGALLVRATFSNAAPWPQPFPRLRFRLYDVNGETIASRVFQPREYLTGTLAADAKLPPAQPLQVALELLAPEEAAVSFEFSFL